MKLPALSITYSKRIGINYEETQTFILVDIAEFDQNPHGQGLEIHDYFANYFMSLWVGSLQEQYIYILIIKRILFKTLIKNYKIYIHENN